MTEEKIIKAILKLAPKVFDCAPDGLGAQRRAEVIAARLYVEGVVVPVCRCYECKHSQPCRTPNYLLCPRRGGGLVRIDGYCDEAEEKDGPEKIAERSQRGADLLEMKRALAAQAKGRITRIPAKKEEEWDWEWFEEWSPGTPEHPRECDDCGWRCGKCKVALEDMVGGYWDDAFEKPKLHYCPNCGAKMKGD